MDYITRLDNYKGPEIAELCQKDEYGLYDQALCIYKKFKDHVEAIKIMLYKFNNFEGDFKLANEFAEKVSTSEVWSELASAQLNKNMLSEAITSFIKAKDPSQYMQVINYAKNQ